MIDFSDKKLILYYIGDLIEPLGNKETFGESKQGVIYVENSDIIKDKRNDYIIDNMIFEKFPKVAKFILAESNSGNRSHQYIQQDIYHFVVAENHNYFVGDLGVLVADSTILQN